MNIALRTLVLCCFVVTQVRADDLAKSLQALKSDVLPQGHTSRQVLEDDLSARLKSANQQSTKAWREIDSREKWEAFRDQKIAALRKSLGDISPDPKQVKVHVTGEIKENGYVVRKIVYESLPGLLVAANLYVPAKPAEKMPGIVISHSHHTPKSQDELQDMGAIWARAGCLVLVPDHIGHGERRQHPFASADDYPDKFQVGRQDYHFRYNTAAQLYLLGDTLMGWMVRDLMRGVDVLLAQPGIDPERIAILGAVAGGGDLAGVTGALDPRIKVVVPFNFGGPQPETRFPLPDDAEDRFDYAGGGSWESTRNLYRSTSDGFLPWVIVGSVAPRGLIHAHEFSWDQERDPVWKRYQRIFGFYQANDRLGFAHGYGLLRQTSAEASHCTHIGKPHRVGIHRFFIDHWGISIDESRPVVKHSRTELACLTDEFVKLHPNQPLHKLATQLAAQRTTAFLAGQKSRSAEERLKSARMAWQKSLGPVETDSDVKLGVVSKEQLENVRIERLVLHGERRIPVPVLLLIPQSVSEQVPVTLIVSQAGKAEYLKQRTAVVAKLLESSAVCLVDPRGVGESKSDSDRGRRSNDTGLAATELMFGETLLAGRLRDVRATLQHLRSRKEFSRIAVLGDSLAPINADDANVKRPLELDQPNLAEPAGATLALLAGLFEDSSLIIATRGGLIDYASILDRQFMHVPFDVIVPGASASGDLPHVAESVSTRNPVWIGGLVDGLNQRAKPDAVEKKYGTLARTDASDEKLVEWLRGELLKSKS